MRKYDYTLMERALTGVEDSEARESLRLMEMNWTPKQILQFFRERDKWRTVRVLQVEPAPSVVLKNTDEPVKIEVLMEDTEESTDDQVTDAVTEERPKPKNDLFRTRKKVEA